MCESIRASASVEEDNLYTYIISVSERKYSGNVVKLKGKAFYYL